MAGFDVLGKDFLESSSRREVVDRLAVEILVGRVLAAGDGVPGDLLGDAVAQGKDAAQDALAAVGYSVIAQTEQLAKVGHGVGQQQDILKAYDCKLHGKLQTSRQNEDRSTNGNASFLPVCPFS